MGWGGGGSTRVEGVGQRRRRNTKGIDSVTRGCEVEQAFVFSAPRARPRLLELQVLTSINRRDRLLLVVDSSPRAALARFERSGLAMAKDGSDAEPTAFVKLPDPTSGAFVEADVRSYLKKWDLAGNSRVHRFRYTRPFHRMDPEPFLRDFFDSDVVREHFEVVDAKGQWRSLTDAAGASAGARCVGVRHEIVPCAATSMAHFDPILERADPPIVREGTDALLKRVDDVIEGFTVADELRDFLLNESSENADLVDEDARRSFCFASSRTARSEDPCVSSKIPSPPTST